MTVTDIRRDAESLSMIVTAEFDAPVDRVWRLWADPRLLERWWGPPSWPATFVQHELAPGADVSYYMTGPEGERSPGWWRVRAVDAPRSLEFDDGFSHPDGSRNDEMPVMVMHVRLDDRAGGGTTMTIRTAFPSAAAMEQILSMGMEEGLSAAMGQMDALLA